MALKFPALAGWALMVAACASGPTRTPDEDLPRYTPAEAALFDDSIASTVMARSASSRNFRSDAKLIERTHRSDTVFQARVTTVSRGGESPSAPYSITVQPLQPLAGSPPQGPVSLELAAGTEVATRLGQGEQLVGKTLVIFLRRHWGASGVEVHFRGEPDRPEVHEAVRQAAKTLDEPSS